MCGASGEANMAINIRKSVFFFALFFAVFTFLTQAKKRARSVHGVQLQLRGRRVNGAGWGECVSIQKQFEESGKNDSLHNKLRKSVNIAKLFSKQNHETEQSIRTHSHRNHPVPSKARGSLVW